jgi:hypothetical protein
MRKCLWYGVVHWLRICVASGFSFIPFHVLPRPDLSETGLSLTGSVRSSRFASDFPKAFQGPFVSRKSGSTGLTLTWQS